MSLLNFNPPPLATPDTACAGQSSAPVDDDPVSAELFAQLVAAAAVANAPLVPAIVAEQKITTEGNATTPRVDAAVVDLRAALAAMPAGAAATTVAAVPEHTIANEQTPIAAAPTRLPTPRIERATARNVEAPVERDDARSVERNDVRMQAVDSALRDRLAAALAPRAATQPARSAPTAIANEANTRGASLPAAEAKSAPEIRPLAAALVAAADHERSPGQAASARSNLVDTAVVASAPSPAPALPHSATAAVAHVKIDTPVGAPGFASEVATRIAHVVLRNERAELRVSPPELGPVDIRIDFKSDSASLTIVAVQPATRDALEQALPQLRESLAAQGIALGHAAIHDGRAQGEQRHADGNASLRATTAHEDDAQGVAADRVRRSDRIVDTFA
jgi:flagellar hook-length control protein FliK